MSQLIKVLQVLDLFNEDRITVSAEEVAALMGISRTTAFRYVRQLTEAGLLSKLSQRYALGARIIQLDYKIRRFDPMLLCSRDLMKGLASASTCSALLSSLYGEEIVNVHHEAGQDQTAISFGRGRPLPLFRGAASKIILANLPPARLKRLYAKYAQHPDVRELGKSLEEFVRFFRECRRRGHYVSHGEVDIGVTGIAAPIFNAEGLVIGSLALVFDSQREPIFNEHTLAGMLRNTADEISTRLKRTTTDTPQAGSPPMPETPRTASQRRRVVQQSP